MKDCNLCDHFVRALAGEYCDYNGEGWGTITIPYPSSGADYPNGRPEKNPKWNNHLELNKCGECKRFHHGEINEKKTQDLIDFQNHFNFRW